jgi:hypothetical protein
MTERTPIEPAPIEPELDEDELLPTDEEPAGFFEDPETPDLGDVDDNLNA